MSGKYMSFKEREKRFVQVNNIDDEGNSAYDEEILLTDLMNHADACTEAVAITRELAKVKIRQGEKVTIDLYKLSWLASCARKWVEEHCEEN